MGQWRSRGRSPARPIAGILGRVLHPVVRRRGLAGADLVLAWPELVGGQFAGCTLPDRIMWPRSESEESAPGTLVVRCSGPVALLLQHEAPLVCERVNGFLGWHAIARLKIVQGPVVAAPGRQAGAPRVLTAERRRELDRQLEGISDPRLRAALARLGTGVAASAPAVRRHRGRDAGGE